MVASPMIHRPSREQAAQALCAPPIDRDMLRRTLPNLVENAIRHGSAIGHINA